MLPPLILVPLPSVALAVPPKTLTDAAAAVLQQGQRLLHRLPDQLYRHAPAQMSASAVGGHFRHVLDHFASLLAGLPAGVVDYDARQRDADVERDRHRALQVARELERQVRLLSGSGDVPLLVLTDSGEGARRQPSRTSLLRELQFVTSHAVHHYAMIALLLRAQGHDVEPGFGVAPSTRAFLAAADKESSAACAR